MISKQTIKDENLSHEDVIDIIQDVTGQDHISAEFIYAIEMGQIEGNIISDVPDNFQDVISNTPKNDKAIGQYLKDLVADGTITTDDVTFLIDSGVLKN